MQSQAELKQQVSELYHEMEYEKAWELCYEMFCTDADGKSATWTEDEWNKSAEVAQIMCLSVLVEEWFGL